MTDLTARIESADGPDRELDVAIHESIGNAVDRGCPADWHSEDETPRYTASIDAALTLVPDDLVWHVSSGDRRGGYVSIESGDDRVPEFKGLASTPALALAAAALKARGV